MGKMYSHIFKVINCSFRKLVLSFLEKESTSSNARVRVQLFYPNLTASRFRCHNILSPRNRVVMELRGKTEVVRHGLCCGCMGEGVWMEQLWGRTLRGKPAQVELDGVTRASVCMAGWLEQKIQIKEGAEAWMLGYGQGAPCPLCAAWRELLWAPWILSPTQSPQGQQS